MHVLNGLCLLMLLVSALCSNMGSAFADARWYNAAGQLIIWPLILPFGPVSWLAALITTIRNSEREGFGQLLGRKWIWLVVWPVAQVFMFFASILVLAGLSGM